MADRRGRKGRSEDLLPEDRASWAKQVWADWVAVAKKPDDAWMLHEVAGALRL